MNNKVSVILPAFNEEDVVEKVIDDVSRVMEKASYDFEIILIDDASTDRTAQIARQKGVIVIQHATNRGVGAARKTGVLHARGDIIVMLDVDGTYPAESIPELLKYMPQYDQVIGCRKSEQGTLRLLRQPAKWLLFTLASFLVKQKIPDLNSGFRALKKDILLKYLYLIPNGFSCVSTMTLSFLFNHYNVKYIPIDYYRRVGKSKFKIFIDTRDFLFTILRISMFFNPFRMLVPVAFFFLAIGMIKTGYDVFMSSASQMKLSDFLFIIIGVIIFILSLLADLIVTLNRRNENNGVNHANPGN